MMPVAPVRALLAVAVLASSIAANAADSAATVARVKLSIVAMGTFAPTRSPQFQFRGTGFAVGDGTLVVTNAHVVPETLDSARREAFGFVVPGQASSQFREAIPAASEPGTDLAVLRVRGAALPPLTIGDSDLVREGQEVLLTGFPIGAVLGVFAATHRGMIAAIAPIAIPQARSAELSAQVVRRLSSGSFPIFQLDATAYPGNSGSPVYDPATGNVLGIVNMVLIKGTRESAITQPSGITYAVPARHLRELLDRVR
jgi:serine protease Do